MKQGIIGINLLFSDGDHLFVDENMFSHLYIANIDEDANEIPYEKLFKTTKLYANYFSLKINHLADEITNTNLLKKINEKKNLMEIELQFNHKTVCFHLATDLDPFKRNSQNSYDQSFFDEEDLCLLICPYNLKYKRHLFI